MRRLFQLFKKQEAFLLKIVFFGFFFIFLSLLFSNLTPNELRARFPVLNRVFYLDVFSFKHIYEKYQANKLEINSETDITMVDTFKINEEFNVPTLNYSALVEPEEKVEIYSKVSGRIEKISVDEGDYVKKGQLLAKLDSLTFELDFAKQKAAVESASAQEDLAKNKYENAKRNVEVRLAEADKRSIAYEKAKSEFERTSEIFKKKEKLFSEGVISSEELKNLELDYSSRAKLAESARKDLEMILIGLRDSDVREDEINKTGKSPQEIIELYKNLNTEVEKSEYEVAKKNLEASRVALKTTEMLIKESSLLSPMDGIVAKRNKSIGELINAGGSGAQSIFTIISVKSIYISFFVNENDISKIKIGQKATIKADSNPTVIYDGYIRRISPMIDEKTHTAEVKVYISQPRGLKPGMFVRAQVEIGEGQKSIFVPLTAVLSSDDKAGTVFLLSGKNAFKANVQLGSKRDDSVEILEGLIEGDELIISPLSRMRDGLEVRPNLK